MSSESVSNRRSGEGLERRSIVPMVGDRAVKEDGYRCKGCGAYLSTDFNIFRHFIVFPECTHAYPPGNDDDTYIKHRALYISSSNIRKTKSKYDRRKDTK